ncbi:MAG: DUF2017 family protein [Acidimicrobiia bacterium]|jgi:hypothetical protein|nr:DUF2017 family protein [Acidimicrobiia bacterium]MDQ3392113.1 DUF2017 domain-containing protein [Actinomycetota bacterium]
MFEPPIERTDDGIAVRIPSDERSLLLRLLDELSQILHAQASDSDTVEASITARLNPSVYDDVERNEEYHRLMGDELLASRMGAIDTVRQALSRDAPHFDEGGANAFMRSLNTIRLVLGTMLGITDDNQDDEDDEEGLSESPEYQLYAYLSWLLEWTVRSM